MEIVVLFETFSTGWVIKWTYLQGRGWFEMVSRSGNLTLRFLTRVHRTLQVVEILWVIFWNGCLYVQPRKYNDYECDLHVTLLRKFLIIKPTGCTDFSNLFLEWNSTCFAQFLCPSSGVFHCIHIIGICHTILQSACEQDQNVPSWSCSQAVCKTVWHIPLLCVQWKTPDDGQRNCPKHVEFHSKNKFEKLVHLVGFIIRDYDYVTGEAHCCVVLLLLQQCGHVLVECNLQI
jgi:hypothetical protein